MTSQTLASWTFTMDDQKRFAALSGDWNPMHMDPVAARRTLAGNVVVHGVHATLCALEKLAANGVPISALQGVRARFSKFIYVGERLTLKSTAWDADRGISAEITNDEGVTLVALKLSSSSKIKIEQSPDLISTPLPTEPIELPFADMGGATGSYLLPQGPSASAALPALTAAWGEARVQAIAGMSSIVGMLCPGLHSVFASLEFRIVDQHGPAPFWFRTIRADDRVRSVTMAAGGSGVMAEITAFERGHPVKADPVSALRGRVGPRDFHRATALILGGSRGLGAATAKLWTAGGGQALITYARGAEDAQAVCDEINGEFNEARCQAAKFDLYAPIGSQLDAMPLKVESGTPLHLFYFATPVIARQKARYSHALFEEFSRAYVGAFEETCRHLISAGFNVKAFYPSTVYVDDRPAGMSEYAMAKAAGELLCHDLQARTPGLEIVVRRLERVATDQNTSLIPVALPSSADVMLPILQHSFAPAV